MSTNNLPISSHITHTSLTMWSNYSHTDRKSPLKPIILTPPISQCCDSTLISRNRPSFPIVYTTMGTYIAASYHSICCHCSKVYYPSHYEVPHENTTVFYDVSKHTRYIQISSQTVFEISYLERVTNELSICSTTFEALADAYTMNNLEQDKDRLQHLQSFSTMDAECSKTRRGVVHSQTLPISPK